MIGYWSKFKGKALIFSFVEIEIHATTYDGTLEEFSTMLWMGFFDKKNKKTVLNIAREFNIYPTLANVHYQVIQELTKRIAL